MTEPLSAKEEALYREGLRNAPTVTDGVPWSLLQSTTAEWADRCRRLLATLDRERAATPPALDREALARAIDFVGTHKQDDDDWTLTRAKYPSELAADIIRALSPTGDET